jgi:osmoprotectant transport system substrate-binding protein
MKKLLIVIFSVFILLTTVVGCTNKAATTATKGTITVSSKADTEGSLLSQVITLMLEVNRFQVINKPAIAGTSLIRQALLSGDIDMYPEYTGNGALFFPNVDPNTWKDAQLGYEEIMTMDKQINNIIWLQPAPANNTWAIAIPKSLSDSQNITSLTDLATYVNKGRYLKLAGSEEFITSGVALPAFEKAYGFTLTNSQLISLAGGNTAQTEKYAADGTDGVNAAMAYGTDGSLSALNLIVLSDPQGVQPVYEPAPTVRGIVYDKYPELSTILNPVFQTLDLTTLQSLNAAIAINGQNPSDVAHNYLVSKNFLK